MKWTKHSMMYDFEATRQELRQSYCLDVDLGTQIFGDFAQRSFALNLRSIAFFCNALQSAELHRKAAAVSGQKQRDEEKSKTT